MTILAWFKCRPLSLLGVFFFLVLAPTSSIVPIVSEPVAERRVYLPLTSVLIVLTVGIMKILNQIQVTSGLIKCRQGLQRATFLLLSMIIASIYVTMTYYRSEIFRNELVFWRDVTEKRPLNARGFNNLGVAFNIAKEPDKAQLNFLRAIQIAPYHVNAHRNLQA